MATSHAPLPLQSLPLRYSGGGVNVAARHILLALYLHHPGLHLPDQQLPALKAAAPAPEAWAETAPDEVADYLRRTCRAFNTASGGQKEAPYPLSALLYPAQSLHPSLLGPPEGWASFRNAHLAAPSEAAAAQMATADQGAYVRGLEACLREAHCWHTSAPSSPRGQGVSPAPDTQQAEKAKTGQGAHQRARKQRAAPLTGIHTQPHRTPSLPRHRSTPAATPSPAPTTNVVRRHPSPAAWHPDTVLCVGPALAVRRGKRGALVSGDMDEGVEEEVSDTLCQGGHLDEGGPLDALDGARGVEP